MSNHEWQLIATAPRDGTPIFGQSCKTGRRGVVHFNGREWELIGGLLELPMGVGFYPTHWHPLLPAPKRDAP